MKKKNEKFERNLHFSYFLKKINECGSNCEANNIVYELFNDQFLSAEQFNELYTDLITKFPEAVK